MMKKTALFTVLSIPLLCCLWMAPAYARSEVASGLDSAARVVERRPAMELETTLHFPSGASIFVKYTSLGGKISGIRSYSTTVPSNGAVRHSVSYESKNGGAYYVFTIRYTFADGRVSSESAHLYL